MATSLQKQLSLLKETRGIEQSHVIGHSKTVKESFFFSTRDASLLSADDLYGLAIEGLDELSDLEGRFAEYKQNLFNESSKELHRELLTEDENRKLDIPVDNLLRLLSPFFLLQPAHKVIEYLVRKFKIHRFNTDSVMACILPYHETTLFARLVQILNINSSRWRFLKPIQANGTPIPRETLVSRALRDHELIVFICEMTQRAVQEGTATKTLLGFYGVFISDLLSSAKPLSDGLVKTVFPFLLFALHPISTFKQQTSLSEQKSQSVVEKDSGEEVNEYRTASLMSLTVTAARISLTRNFVTQTSVALIEAMTRRTSSMRVRRNLFTHALLCLVYLCQSQKQFIIPHENANKLLEHPHFRTSLSQINEKYDVTPFLGMVLPSFLQRAIGNEHNFNIVASIVKDISLGNIAVPTIQELLKHILENENENIASLKKVLFLFDNYYPEELDQAINLTVKGAVNNKQRQKVLSFVQLIFQGTGHEQLQEADNSLFMALSHPQSNIRALAINRLVNINSNDNGKSVSAALSVALKRVANGAEDGNVNLAKMLKDILNFPHLIGTIGSDKLFAIVKSCIEHFQEINFEQPAREVCEFLCTNHKHFGEQALPLMLQLLFFRARKPKCASIVMKVMRKIQHPLLKFDNIPVFDSKSSSLLKAETTFNDAVAKQIGQALADNLSQYLEQIISMLADPSSWRAASHILVHTLNFKIPYNIKLMICKKLLKHSKLGHIKKLHYITSHFVWVLDSVASHSFHVQLNILQFLHQMPVKEVDFCNWINADEEEEEDNEDPEIFQRREQMGILQDITIQLFSVSGSLVPFHSLLSKLLEHLGPHAVQYLLLTVGVRQRSIPNIASVRMLQVAKAISKKSPYGRFMQVFIYLVPSLLSEDKTIASTATRALQSLFTCSDESSPDSAFFESLQDLDDSTVSDTDDYTYDTKAYKQLASLVKGLKNANSNITPALVATIVSKQGIIADLLVAGLVKLSVAKDVPTFLRYVLELFSEVPSQVKIKESIPALREITEYVNGGYVLDNDELGILENIIAEISNARGITATNALDIVLSATKQTVLEAGMHQTPFVPAAKAIYSMKGSLFSSLSNQSQSKVLLCIARIRGVHQEITSAVSEVFSDIALQADLLVGAIELSNASRYLEKPQKIGSKQVLLVLDSDKILSRIQDLDCIIELGLLAASGLQSADNLFLSLFDVLRNLVQEHAGVGGEEKTQIGLSISNIVHLLHQISFKIYIKEGHHLCPPENIDLLFTILTNKELAVARNHTLSMISKQAKNLQGHVLEKAAVLVSTLGRSMKRQDDYSYIVVSKSINTLIPIIQKNTPTPQIVDAFVKTLPFIASHRRTSFAMHLMQKLFFGEYCFILSVFTRFEAACIHALERPEEGIMHRQSKKYAKIAKALETEAGFFPVQLCHALLSRLKLPAQFTVLLQLVASCYAKDHLLEERREELEHFKISQGIKPYLLLFVNQHLSYEPFLEAILANNGKLLGYSLLEILLKCLKSTQNDTDYSIISETTQKVVQLIPTSHFHRIMASILEHKDPSMQVMAFELLNSSIITMKSSSWKYEIEILMNSILPVIGQVLGKVGDPKTKQNALFSLSLLLERADTKLFIAFEQPLKSVAQILEDAQNQRFEVVCAAAMCFGTMCARFRLKAVKLLPKFFPTIIALIKAFLLLSQDYEQHSSIPNLPQGIVPKKDKGKVGHIKQNLSVGLHSLLSSVHAVIQSIPQLVSPYLPTLFSLIYHPHMAQDVHASKHIKSMIAVLALNLEARLMLEPLFQAFSTTLLYGDSSVCLLFDNVAKLIQSLSLADLEAHSAKILKFYLSAFDLRRLHSNKLTSVDDVEKVVIKSFLSYILRLNENRFKPMFLKLVDWSNEPVGEGNEQGNVDRYITFYQFAIAATKKLQTLFVPYYGYILGYCSQILRRFSGNQADRQQSVQESKTKKKRSKKRKHQEIQDDIPDDKKHEALCHIIDALNICFINDKEGVVASGSRFEIIMEPLVEQLENTTVGNSKQFWDRVESHVVPCVVRLAATVASDNFWKTINYQVLQRMSSDNVMVRYAALLCVEGFFTEIGEPFLTMLPETLSYLAEAMEDDDTRVQSITNRIMHKLEELSGEDIQSMLREAE